MCIRDRLSGICIRSSENMVRAAEIISREYGCAVLCKGGHRLNAVSYTHLDVYKRQTLDRDGKDGVFRAVCLDGKIVGNISVEQGTDVYRCGAEIGYMLDHGPMKSVAWFLRR